MKKCESRKGVSWWVEFARRMTWNQTTDLGTRSSVYPWIGEITILHTEQTHTSNNHVVSPWKYTSNTKKALCKPAAKKCSPPPTQKKEKQKLNMGWFFLREAKKEAHGCSGCSPSASLASRGPKVRSSKRSRGSPARPWECRVRPVTQGRSSTRQATKRARKPSSAFR